MTGGGGGEAGGALLLVSVHHLCPVTGRGVRTKTGIQEEATFLSDTGPVSACVFLISSDQRRLAERLLHKPD